MAMGWFPRPAQPVEMPRCPDPNGGGRLVVARTIPHAEAGAFVSNWGIVNGVKPPRPWSLIS